MSDANPVADAEADLARAEAELAAAEQAPAEKSTEELLAAAPPLVLPAGQKLLKVCPNCGTRYENPPPNMACPNCGTVIP